MEARKREKEDNEKKREELKKMVEEERLKKKEEKERLKIEREKVFSILICINIAVIQEHWLLFLRPTWQAAHNHL